MRKVELYMLSAYKYKNNSLNEARDGKLRKRIEIQV